MAKEMRKIKAISYVYVGDVKTPVSDLNEEQRERLAVSLQWGILTSVYGGEAQVTPPQGFECGFNRDGNITCRRVPSAAALS